MDEAMARRLTAAFERLPALVDDDPVLLRRGRWITVDLLVELGDVPYHVALERGRVAALERGPRLMRPWRFAVRGTAEAWRGFWREEPAPGDHDVFALAKRGLLRLEGDLHPLMANLLYFKDLLALPRRVAGRG
jgi:hypothetical protein